MIIPNGRVSGACLDGARSITTQYHHAVSKASDHEKISKILFQIDFLINILRALHKRTDGHSRKAVS